MDDRLSQPWRRVVAGAGVALGLLPLLHGEWGGAAFGAVIGLAVTGLWVSLTRLGAAAGSAVGGAAVAAMAALFAVSQWPRDGLLRAPALDYLQLWVLVGVAVGAALVAEGLFRRRLRAGPTAAVAVVLLAPFVGCSLLPPNAGVLESRFPARAGEVLPLPANLRLAWWDSCAAGGSSGNCTAEYVVTAADGAAPDVVTERLAVHLRGLGWPLGPRLNAERRVGGILSWQPHTLWFSDTAARRDRPAPPGSVVVFVDDSG
jgi:hypothetical protein